MVLANPYFKDIGLIQTLIFSPYAVFHFLHCSQQSLHHVYFLQFSLISVRPAHFYISLWNLQIALVTDVPRVIIITLVLFGQSKAAHRLKSLHFILAQFGNSLIAAACPLKSIWKEHNRNTVIPLEERSHKSLLTLSIIEHVDRLLMSQMGLLIIYW